MGCVGVMVSVSAVERGGGEAYGIYIYIYIYVYVAIIYNYKYA